MTTLLLNCLSLGILLSAIFVITASNPVSSVLYLIATFVCGGCYLILMGLGFVGLSYLIVYIGAVAILFLFVVILMNVQYQELITIGREYSQNIPLGFMISIVFLLELFSIGPSLIVTITNLPGELFNNINQILFSQIGATNFSQYTANNNLHESHINTRVDIMVSNSSQIELLGYGLYTYGTMWLLLTSIVLLLAIMGPIVLCMRRAN